MEGASSTLVGVVGEMNASATLVTGVAASTASFADAVTAWTWGCDTSATWEGGGVALDVGKACSRSCMADTLAALAALSAVEASAFVGILAAAAFGAPSALTVVARSQWRY